MKKVICGVICLAFVSVTINAIAEECDSWFKKMEVYRCERANVDYQSGVGKNTTSSCISWEKMNVPTCEISELETINDNFQHIVLIGPKEFDYTKWEFKCEPYLRNVGMKGGGFKGNYHPDFSQDKFPSKYDYDLDSEYYKSLAAKGKAVAWSTTIYPTQTANNVGPNQACKITNPTTSAVLAKFDVKVNQPGDASSKGGEKKGNPLKKMFGK